MYKSKLPHPTLSQCDQVPVTEVPQVVILWWQHSNLANLVWELWKYICLSYYHPCRNAVSCRTVFIGRYRHVHTEWSEPCLLMSWLHIQQSAAMPSTYFDQNIQLSTSFGRQGLYTSNVPLGEDNVGHAGCALNIGMLEILDQVLNHIGEVLIR